MPSVVAHAHPKDWQTVACGYRGGCSGTAFTDQPSHAARRGRHALAPTFHLPLLVTRPPAQSALGVPVNVLWRKLV